MVNFKLNAKNFRDAESMATAYLTAYFGNSEIEYPISPFKMLKDEGVDFFIRNFNKLEGVYIPAQSKDDIAIVGINAKRPITRQRFTAAHELCHHLEMQISRLHVLWGRKTLLNILQMPLPLRY